MKGFPGHRRKPAPASARTRDFGGVRLQHGPDLRLSAGGHHPKLRVEREPQTANNALYAAQWSLGDGGV